MIRQFDIPDFRKSMILELYEKKLKPIIAEPVKPAKYYAVDYINNYYFGRVLEAKSNGFIKFKFLHSAGCNKHDWPRRDDVSCIFYGPVHLEGNRPLVITEREEVDKVFLAAKKHVLKFLPRHNQQQFLSKCFLNFVPKIWFMLCLQCL